jgi:hypothetical protein
MNQLVHIAAYGSPALVEAAGERAVVSQAPYLPRVDWSGGTSGTVSATIDALIATPAAPCPRPPTFKANEPLAMQQLTAADSRFGSD